LDLLLKEYETCQATAAANFYFSLVGTLSAASLCSRIMERQVLKYFDSLKGIQGFKIHTLNNSIISNWNYPGPTKCVTFQAQLFTPSLESAVGSEESLHLVPLDLNFAVIDSVLYNPSKVLAGIQVTISHHHPVVISGLKHIQSWLKVDGLLAHLQPSRSSNHWQLSFISSLWKDILVDGNGLGKLTSTCLVYQRIRCGEEQQTHNSSYTNT